MKLPIGLSVIWLAQSLICTTNAQIANTPNQGAPSTTEQPDKPPSNESASVNEKCYGSFPGCCGGGHGGIDARRIDDGDGYIKCNNGDEYPKRPSCACE